MTFRDFRPLFPVKGTAPRADTLGDGTGRGPRGRLHTMDEHHGSLGDLDVTDLTARRPDVLRRLIDRGVPADTLQMLFPDWEPFFDVALGEPAPAR